MTLVNPVQSAGSLCYLKYDDRFKHEKPFFIRFPIDDIPEAKQTNLEFDYYNVSIEDIRGRESQFKLDEYGFELAKFQTRFNHEDFEDFRENSKTYFKEIEDFLKKKLGVTWVEVYDCTVGRARYVLLEHVTDLINRYVDALLSSPQRNFKRSMFNLSGLFTSVGFLCDIAIQTVRQLLTVPDSSRGERVKQALLSLEKAGLDPRKGRTQMIGYACQTLIQRDYMLIDSGCGSLLMGR